jgi:hypothetical protein
VGAKATIASTSECGARGHLRSSMSAVIMASLSCWAACRGVVRQGWGLRDEEEARDEPAGRILAGAVLP